MQRSRRHILKLVAGAAALPGTSRLAKAQAYTKTDKWAKVIRAANIKPE